MDKLENLSAIELGEKVNSQEIKPTEVIDYFAHRIEERNPSINAFVYTKFDEAMEEAKKLEYKIMKHVEYAGPFAGVPFALKDFLPSKKGWTASHGGVKSLITVDEESGEFCKAMERLGGIAIGKTNAPSFGFRATTDNLMYGPTSTPFNTEYNSGGSSGGSASAVADGLVYAAEGGDAGGSTRGPSAWCGVFGFKPSAGLVPSVCRPDAWTATHPYCCGGPITRTVDDAATVMDMMQHYNPRDPLSVPLGIKNWYNNDLSKLKIGYTLNFDLFPLPEPEVGAAILRTIYVLKSIGANIEEVKFDFKCTKRECEEAWLRGICIDTAIDMEFWKQKGYDLAGDHREEVAENFFKWNEIALKSNMMDYRKFHEVRTQILDAHQDVFDKYDIILAPVTGCMPIKNTFDHDTKGPEFISGVKVDPLIGFAYTFLENMIGTPAASVPIGIGSNNLPIGLQVIGRRYFDEDVFTVARQIERNQPWDYTIPFNRSI